MYMESKRIKLYGILALLFIFLFVYFLKQSFPYFVKSGSQINLGYLFRNRIVDVITLDDRVVLCGVCSSAEEDYCNKMYIKLILNQRRNIGKGIIRHFENMLIMYYFDFIYSDEELKKIAFSAFMYMHEPLSMFCLKEFRSSCSILNFNDKVTLVSFLISPSNYKNSNFQTRIRENIERKCSY